MTEAEWLACEDPNMMLGFLDGKVSKRKLRLFAVACCRNIWSLFKDEQCRNTVEVAERYADGWASDAELFAVNPGGYAWLTDAEDVYYLVDELFHALSGNTFDAYYVFRSAEIAFGARKAEEHCAIFRDIANPFFSAGPRGRFATTTATEVAEAIYTDRAFDRLPILADALEDAGCTDRAILDHCRQPGEHVRGCWVVDLVLGKE